MAKKFDRREFLAKTFALSCSAALGGCTFNQTDVSANNKGASGSKAGIEPNIVFFLVDDLGWRDVGCYGSSFYETPNIDRLATEGVRFTQAYATCHVCSPTRASIMTGKYPARLNLTDWLPGRKDYDFQSLKNAEKSKHLPFEEVTLAEVLKANGYSTAIFGKWHLGEEPSGPLAHGFDLQVPRWNKGWPKSGYHTPFGMEGLKDSKGDYLTDRLTDEALNYIERNKDRPFFLYLSHFAVHDPIQGRPDLVTKYRKKLVKMQRSKGPAFILEGNPDDAKPLSREQLTALMAQPSHQGYKVLPERTVKIKQHQDNIEFAAMVESMDESLGRILKKLKEAGLAENTIVIFFSDNGGMSAANFGNPKRQIPESKLDGAYSTSNLPLRGAKGWLYEGGIRVPMIVKWPGHGNKGAVCEEPVISTDFYPAILEMAGLPWMPDQHVDGVSFVPALKGEPFDRKAIYWHFPHYSNHGMQSPGGAIRLGDYKLLEYFENNTVQLFNLKADPSEQNDLARSQPKKAAELLKMLRVWRQEVSAQMMPNKSKL
jgi:arylsulfatase A-like enzyme